MRWTRMHNHQMMQPRTNIANRQCALVHCRLHSVQVHSNILGRYKGTLYIPHSTLFSAKSLSQWTSSWKKDFSTPWKLVHCSSVLHQCECAPPQVPKLKQTSWTRVCLQRLSLPETCKSYLYEDLTADLFRLFLPLQATTRWQDLIPIQAEEQKVENTGDN